MATTLRGSGTETGLARLVDGVKLASGLWLADITDAIGVATFDYRTGAVPEFTFDAVDRDRASTELRRVAVGLEELGAAALAGEAMVGALAAAIAR